MITKYGRHSTPENLKLFHTYIRYGLIVKTTR